MDAGGLSPQTSSKRLTALHLAVLVLVGCAVLVPNLGQTLRVSDREGRHAEIAREMVETHQYVVPYTLGRPYLDKPPLFNWTIAAAFRLTGKADLFAARLSSALSALLVGLIIYALGRRWFSPRAALWSALMWFTFPLVMEWGKRAQVDVVFTALIAAGILAALYAASSRSTATAFVLWCGACLLASAAVLAKGPHGLFFFSVGVVAIWRTERGRWVPPGTFIAAGAILLALAYGGWMAAAEAQRAGHVEELLQVQFGRGLVQHIRRPSLYVDQLLLQTAPWAFLGIGALYFAVARLVRKGLVREGVPTAAFAAAFLLMNLVPNKREHYLLPILPLWALIIGDYLDRCASAPALRDERGSAEAGLGRRATRWLFACPLGVIFVAAIATGPAAALWPKVRGEYGMAPAVLGAALAIPAAWGLLALARRRYARSVWALSAIALAGAVGTYYAFVEPHYEEHEGIALARRVESLVSPESAVGVYGVTDETFIFALGRRVEFLTDEAALLAFLQRPGPRVLLVGGEDVGKVEGLLPGVCVELGRWPLGSGTICLLSRGPGRGVLWRPGAA
jgi:4-amino-4-deoxy-L-arabinose transferase-like glycosyltransferase